MKRFAEKILVRYGVPLMLPALCGPASAQTSSLVFEGPDGKLVYEGYANEGQTRTGNKMIDFSRAGYMGGGVAIPWVPVAVALDPLSGDGDDHARIQAAIDTVSALPPSSAGFRGTVLLRAGAYRVSQSLRITASGVVIRGEGQHAGGTVILFTATVQDNLFEFAGSGGWTKIAGTEAPITDTLVPSGARSFHVASTDGLAVGDRLMVHRTPNQAWITLLGMDQLESYGVPGVVNWTPEGYWSQTPRVITAIDGDTVTVDAPLVHAIESQYDGGGIANAMENFFGTHPGEVSRGLAVEATDDSLTFTHPQNPTPASDLSAAYLWSTDLVTFHLGGTEADGTTVTFHPEPGVPEPGITTVTATITGNPVDRLFVTVRVTGN